MYAASRPPATPAPLRLLIRLLCVLAVVAALPAPGWAAEPTTQLQSDQPIFRRFSTPPRRSEARLRIFEIPVAVRPQTDAQADVFENLGIGYTVASLPFNRVFASVGFDFARMSWTPTNPEILSAKVREFEVHQNLNFWLWRTVIVSFGLGLGVMDGLVVKQDGKFEHNLVPYIPVRLGLGYMIADKVYVGLRAVAVPFFGDGHEVGQSRLLLGFGWAY